MRQLVILTSAACLPEPFFSQLAASTGGKIHLPAQDPVPFSNAKSLLGQEFPFAIYDMRAADGVCFHLDAFAMVAGTIQRRGKLYLLCPNWAQLAEQLDFDALRWHANTPIATPNFYRWFKQLVEQFQCPVFQPPISDENRPLVLPATAAELPCASSTQNTREQQFILDHLPNAPAAVHLITAPRGRGKSTLAGRLAQKLAKKAPVLITARSQHAFASGWAALRKATSEDENPAENIQFYAPDKLLKLIEIQALSRQHWLLIDEAASLPLPMLLKLCHYFEQVVLTTTTQHYEGTGRGFSLKFPPQLKRPFRHWQLSQPLRWAQNDPLERFICQLLLLEDEQPSAPQTQAHWQKMGKMDRLTLAQKIDFYQLLAHAHYKTTPTDLRRLFDAPNQQFYALNDGGKLIAGAWAMFEGGLDETLTVAIWRGVRRPAGNLVAQYLCLHGNLPDACRLRSLRISRLAVQPSHQQQGYGKRLISQIFSQLLEKAQLEQNSPPKTPLVDFVSVSFGLSPALLAFWQSCGFQLVQITPNAEASSGLPSAMMIRPLSARGNAFCQQARHQFLRDQALLNNAPNAKAALNKTSETQCENESESRNANEAQKLTACDWQNLHGFAHAQRPFSACQASLTRLALATPNFPFSSPLPSPKTKAEIVALRQWVGEIISQLNQK